MVLRVSVGEADQLERQAKRKNCDTTQMIVCLRCGEPALRRGPVQKYCEECSELRDIERKRVWGRNHQPPAEIRRPRIAAYREARKLESHARGAELARSISWDPLEDLGISHLVRVAVPFDYGMSKNAIWRFSRDHGHVYLRRRATALRNELIEVLRKACRERPFVAGRLWLDILVQKPNHRGDAVNVLDSVCDAVKVATGIDDRWYSIRRLDWEIVKDDPRLFVGVGQAIEEPERACSYCGRVLQMTSHFPKRKHGPAGFSRVCFECERLNEGIRSSSRDRRKKSGGEPDPGGAPPIE